MRYILAVNFCWAKEMIYLNKNSSTPAQKRFREFIAAIFRNLIKTSQPTQRRRKDVVKRLNFGLKDVLDWSEMEVATTFF